MINNFNFKINRNPPKIEKTKIRKKTKNRKKLKNKLKIDIF